MCINNENKVWNNIFKSNMLKCTRSIQDGISIELWVSIAWICYTSTVNFFLFKNYFLSFMYAFSKSPRVLSDATTCTRALHSKLLMTAELLFLMRGWVPLSTRELTPLSCMHAQYWFTHVLLSTRQVVKVLYELKVPELYVALALT